MGEINSTKITRDRLDGGYIPFNNVMVVSDLTVFGKKTKGGIIYGFDEDVQWEDETNSWEADIAQVSGYVYKIPKKLYYNKQDPNNSMPWDCDMDIQVGDEVWFPPMEARSATALECEGKYYKVIPYRDCIVVKRTFKYPPVNTEKYFGGVDPYVERIMLNGYVLLEPIRLKNKSSLAVSEEGEIDMTRGIIRYVGKINREYLNDNYTDFKELEVGDEILLSPNSPLWYLERKSYLSTFNNDKLYWVVQRRRIALVLSKNN